MLLLGLYAKCGSLETAGKIFNQLGSRRNSITWNTMISVYTRVGDLTSTGVLFDSMPEKNVLWSLMISGYAQNGQSAMGIELFKEMVKTNDSIPIKPSIIAFG